MDAVFERYGRVDVLVCNTGGPKTSEYIETTREDWEQALRTAELYRGEYVHHLPDLLVAWSDDKPLGSATVGSGRGARVRLTSRKIGPIEGSNNYCRSGDHRREGLFVAVGPTLSPGKMSRTVSIMDFAPTFTRLLGVELPEADGDPISELLA